MLNLIIFNNVSSQMKMLFLQELFLTPQFG